MTKAWRHVLITDIDNTLYDFGRYFEAGLTGLVRVAESELARSHSYVLGALKEAFTARDTLEYPYVLADLPEVQRLPRERQQEIVRRASDAFWNAGGPALVPYPGVVGTLQHLSMHGVGIVAFTDAPIHEAMRRLRGLGVDRFLSGIVATEWFRRTEHGSPPVSFHELAGFVRLRKFAIVRRLGSDERKPNPIAYERILEACGLPPESATVIGDSPSRDLAPAASIGIDAVWARYGVRHPEAEVLLQQVVPFKLPEITRSQASAAMAFPAVDAFSDIVDYIPTQMSLLPLSVG